MMISDFLLLLSIAWFATSMIREFSDADFKKLLTSHFWRQKLNCSKCLSFWLTLALSFDFVLAAGVSASINLYNYLTTDNNAIQL